MLNETLIFLRTPKFHSKLYASSTGHVSLSLHTAWKFHRFSLLIQSCNAFWLNQIKLYQIWVLLLSNGRRILQPRLRCWAQEAWWLPFNSQLHHRVIVLHFRVFLMFLLDLDFFICCYYFIFLWGALLGLVFYFINYEKNTSWRICPEGDLLNGFSTFVFTLLFISRE